MAHVNKGSRYWIHQRLTALLIIIGLLYLSLALLFFEGQSSITLTFGGFVIEPMGMVEKILYGLKHPMIAAVVLLTFTAAFYHSFLGVRMIIEDYVPQKLLQYTLIFINFILHLFFIMLSFVLILL